MLALRKSRLAASPPFLRGGFRPFFLLAAAWGVATLTLWLCTFSGRLELPTAFEGLAWHRHEMLFGFVGAAFAGFLLTAVPNWTGRLPIAGAPLLLLAAWWLVARLFILFSSFAGLTIAACLDVGFFAVLTLVAGREVIAAKNRNLPMVLISLLFTGADAADYAGQGLGNPDIGWKAALCLIIIMISVIGGRIVPSFTRNWMAKQGRKARLPSQPGMADILVIAATVFCMAGWVIVPANTVTGMLLILAAGLQLIRLARWGGLWTVQDPLVFILHVAYLWIPSGLFLLGLSQLGFAVSESAAVHALTAGAMTTMILAVMTRATLGHTGRVLHANQGTVFLYVAVTLGAILRVTASLNITDELPLLMLSGVLWAGSLVLFLVLYGPMLFRPRVP